MKKPALELLHLGRDIAKATGSFYWMIKERSGAESTSAFLGVP
jgi:hypothetical protein